MSVTGISSRYLVMEVVKKGNRKWYYEIVINCEDHMNIRRKVKRDDFYFFQMKKMILKKDKIMKQSIVYLLHPLSFSLFFQWMDQGSRRPSQPIPFFSTFLNVPDGRPNVIHVWDEVLPVVLCIQTRSFNRMEWNDHPHQVSVIYLHWLWLQSVQFPSSPPRHVFFFLHLLPSSLSLHPIISTWTNLHLVIYDVIASNPI